MLKKFVINFFVFSCIAAVLFGAARSSDAASMVAYQNTFSIPEANGATSGVIANYVMPQFDPTVGTLQSVDVTIRGDPVSYYGENSFPVSFASAGVSLGLGNFGLETGVLGRIFYADGSVTTISGTFAAAQNTQVNTPELWGWPFFLDQYIGTSTIDDGFVYLYEVVGYQLVNSYSWFDGPQSFGPTSFSVEINYNYTPASQVPEPATMLLLGSGLIGLAGYGRKKFFKK